MVEVSISLRTAPAAPMVAVYRPAKPDGRAVLVIPGGGYEFVSIQNEGIDVAATLTPHGITCWDGALEGGADPQRDGYAAGSV